jgi:hypothetical protein
LNKIETAHHTEDQLKDHLADLNGPKQTAEVVLIRMTESPRPQYLPTVLLGGVDSEIGHDGSSL